MAKDTQYMKKVREQTKSLCETFERDSFCAMLKRRSLEKQAEYLDEYIQNKWITPLEIGNKLRFHRGHMLILFRLQSCTDLHYQAGIQDGYDFEDIMSRRVYMCELEAENVRDDAERIEQLFRWIWSDDADLFEPINAVHTKAMIDVSLDALDPNGFYENLKVSEGDGIYRLVQDLLIMQTEIGNIVGLASGSGASIPNVQYLFDRKRHLDEVRELLLPLKSPFLAVPMRDVMADERLEFIRQRNRLLVSKQYQELIDLYENHLYLYDSEVERHADLCVCMGHIYGDLMKDSAKAATAFQEAMEYDSANDEAFEQVSHHLREAEKWPELVELLSNHWDSIDNAEKRCSLILDCARIQAFKCRNVEESLGLFERCMQEGYPGNAFDDLYKIIEGLMDECTSTEKLRALVTLTLHIVNYSQCDKVESTLKKLGEMKEPFELCLSSLVNAGIQSFKGDQPLALEILRDAIVHSPKTSLIDGMLLRIASKMTSVSEFREAMSDLESDSLSEADLSDIWCRVAQVLLRLPNHEDLALEYAEKSVLCDSNNNESVDLCYNLATKGAQPERAFVYATIKAVRTKNPKLRAEIENTCNELKISFADDELKVLSAYETLLQFDDVKGEIGDNIRDLMSNADNEKAIAIIQHVEPKCVESGMSGLVSELYRNVLEREISQTVKRELLERYLGILLAQGSSVDLDNDFIPAHAQLYALAPSDRLFTMLKTAAREDESAIRSWAGLLEDAVLDIDDKTRIGKIQMTLADCYQNILGDSEKAADAFGNLLKAAPDNVPAFKCSFNAFERLERYYDCTEITKVFPLEKLSATERFTYAFKSLTFALIHNYDVNAMKFYIDVIARDDENVIPAVVDQLLEKAAQKSMDNDQLICFLNTLEDGAEGLIALSMRLARARLMIGEGRLSEAVSCLDEATYEAASQYEMEGRIVEAIQGIEDKESSDYEALARIWLEDEDSSNGEESDSGAAETAEKQDSSVNSIDALVKECSENIDDDSFLAVIEGALGTLQPEDKSRLCVKLGALYEEHARLDVAEDFFKRAFGFTQSAELLEFYKRNGKFKKAIKIAKFKIQTAADDAKNAVRLDLAMIYERIGDFSNSVLVLTDILNNKGDLEKAAILAIYRQKAADLMALGQESEAVATLAQASAEADLKMREDIDIDRCLLMRSITPDDARKLYNSLKLRGVKSEKMVLLSLCYDIDADKYSDAESKIKTLLDGANDALKIPALEQRIRMQQKRGDDRDSLCVTARELLALSPENPSAKAILEA